jgi:hypothetical protein
MRKDRYDLVDAETGEIMHTFWATEGKFPLGMSAAMWGHDVRTHRIIKNNVMWPTYPLPANINEIEKGCIKFDPLNMHGILPKELFEI